MKKLIISLIALAACLCATAATREVYVDAAKTDVRFEISLADASTDTLNIYVVNDGDAITASSYTPVLMVSPDKDFYSSKTITEAGTGTGTYATFAVTNFAHSSWDGYYCYLAFRSGGAGAYTYTYPMHGRLNISASPVSVGGDAAVIGTFNAAASIKAGVSVANGAVLTPAYGVYILDGTGQADDYTNTITLANATSGKALTLVVAAASSNLIAIADSGNCELSSAWLGDNNDVINLIGVGTNWVERSASDN